jgi:hypothetical protein
VPSATNLYSKVTLPLFCDGKTELTLNASPLVQEDLRRQLRISKKGIHERGFKFETEDTEMTARIVEQIEYLQEMNDEEFQRFTNNVLMNSNQTIEVVLASLDCDPDQTMHKVETNNGYLSDLVDRRHSGFGVSILNDDYVVNVLMKNQQYHWVSYSYKSMKDFAFNPKWLFLVDDPTEV